MCSWLEDSQLPVSVLPLYYHRCDRDTWKTMSICHCHMLVLTFGFQQKTSGSWPKRYEKVLFWNNWFSLVLLKPSQIHAPPESAVLTEEMVGMRLKHIIYIVLSEFSRIAMCFSWSQVAPCCAMHLSFWSSVNTLKFRRQVALAHWYLGNTEDIAIVVTLSCPMPHALSVRYLFACWKFPPTEHRNQALIERSHLLKSNINWTCCQSHWKLRSNESHLRSTMENPWNSSLYAWKP